jgi:hypothetical protein
MQVHTNIDKGAYSQVNAIEASYCTQRNASRKKINFKKKT